jgi:hypothetical protein
MMRWWLVALVVVGGCGASRYQMHGAPARPFDAVIVPGCPSEDDGSLSRCQMARAVWAASLWQAGWAKNFITSGSAVYSPYVEAEALAAALSELGVPAERIYLETNALHTDENMVYSMLIARRLGWRSIAVASNSAALDCLMLRDWGQECRAYELDLPWVIRRHAALGRPLERVRTRRVDTFVPLKQREREIALATGRHRSPSFVLYLGLGFMRTNGEHWVPPGLPLHQPESITWAQRQQQSPN